MEFSAGLRPPLIIRGQGLGKRQADGATQGVAEHLAERSAASYSAAAVVRLPRTKKWRLAVLLRTSEARKASKLHRNSKQDKSAGVTRAHPSEEIGGLNPPLEKQPLQSGHSYSNSTLLFPNTPTHPLDKMQVVFINGIRAASSDVKKLTRYSKWKRKSDLPFFPAASAWRAKSSPQYGCRIIAPRDNGLANYRVRTCIHPPQ